MQDRQLQQLLDSLRSKLNGQSEVSIQELDDLLHRVVESRDPKCIEPLLLMLRDDTEPHHFVWSMIHAVEAFEPDDYVDELLSALPKLNKQAPELTKTMHFRILNSEACSTLYSRLLQKCDSSTQRAAKESLLRVRESNPKLADRVAQILRGS